MPWQETSRVDERERLVKAITSRRASVAEVSRAFGVSRKTAYKWLGRYRAQGREGLSDRVRAPHRQGRAISRSVAEAIVALRIAQPLLGPRKLRVLLENEYPQFSPPAASTICDLLHRQGLVKPRRRRRRWPRAVSEMAVAHAPNEIWGADFKGWFRTHDGQRCDPLTITDLYSRFLIACQLVANQSAEQAEPVFERVFREYGLPQAIRTDNGPPFGSSALAGLSRLAVKWVKAGIRLEHIEPGRPEQNGRHERMHRTLKAATAAPPARNPRAQQARFDDFRRDFNYRRPHEALGQTPPALHYQRSPRCWPERLEDPCYSADHAVRRVRSNGEIKWCGDKIFVSEALIGEALGLLELQCGDWLINFADLNLAIIDRRTRKLRPAWPAPRLCPCGLLQP